MQSIGETKVLMKKYEEMGKGMRLFEAMVDKSEQSMIKMGFYGAYYKLFSSDLQKEALANSANPRDEVVLNAWNYPQRNPLVSKVMQFMATNVKQFQPLHFFKCTGLRFLQDLEKLILRNLPLDAEEYQDLIVSFQNSHEKMWRGTCTQWNFINPGEAKPEDFSKVTLISDDEIKTFKNGFSIKEGKNKDSVIIFIGGGGFIASTEAIQEHFLRNWAKQTNCSVFEFHYKLAPEHKYPFQLQEVLESYLGVIYYYRHYLGIELKNIIVMGDSAGGNLLLGLVNLLIMFKQRVPDSMILVYPAVNLNDKRFTPSFLNAFKEQLLYFTVLERVLAHYIPNQNVSAKDWLISPDQSPPGLMSKYPETHIFIGEHDPMFDDNIRFAFKLKSLGVQTSLNILKDLFHGFLSFDLPLGQGMSEVTKVHLIIKDIIMRVLQRPLPGIN